MISFDLLQLAALLTLATTEASGVSRNRKLRSQPQKPTQGYPKGRGAANSAFAAYVLISSNLDCSGLIARAVFPVGILCSDVELSITRKDLIGGHVLAMSERLKPQVPADAITAFASVTVCEALLPKDVLTATLGNQALPVNIPDKVSRIAVFGDTGCKASAYTQQNCNDPNDWPLAKVAAQISNSEPELTFFIGDFYYREKDCSFDDLSKCGNSPASLNRILEVPDPNLKDTDYQWIADVFLPWKPIFSAAPLLVVRGNHELCDAGGRGYFLFFDPHLGTSRSCDYPTEDGSSPQITIEPWAVDFKIRYDWNLRLVMFDSSDGNDLVQPPNFSTGSNSTNWSEYYKPFFVKAEALSASSLPNYETWLVTHRPIFGLDDNENDDGPNPNVTWISTQLASASIGQLSTYSAIISSHIHLIQGIQIPDQPGQIVVGNGGTLLNRGNGTQYVREDAPIGGSPASMMWSDVKFGYSVLTPGVKKGEWMWQHYNPEGEQYGFCTQNPELDHSTGKPKGLFCGDL